MLLMLSGLDNKARGTAMCKELDAEEEENTSDILVLWYDGIPNNICPIGIWSPIWYLGEIWNGNIL
jgi:hypothetical protein